MLKYEILSDIWLTYIAIRITLREWSFVTYLYLCIFKLVDRKYNPNKFCFLGSQ